MAHGRKIGVVGLGYVGLPVAVAFGRSVPGTVGFDINKARVASLSEGHDTNGDVEDSELALATISYTSEAEGLAGCDFFVVAVPTPIDQDRRPNLKPLEDASRLVASVMKKGAIVVFESTVYPGVTEEICKPILAEVSGLKAGVDFKVGYSPERINPGDKEHTLERIVKVVSGEDDETLAIVAEVYGSIIEAGIHSASSIKVAEAAKVIENTQRDLNIALMNELSLIFDRLDICTMEVLDAAATKWNFLRFEPGLVGGHCIGVDPYYLTAKAEQLGYLPQVILAGRRINDGMGQFLAQRTIKLLTNAGAQVRGARVGILGLTFKENVSDTRNSQIPKIVTELREFGVLPLVHDPLAEPAGDHSKDKVDLVDWMELKDLDAVIYAVGHRQFRDKSAAEIESLIKPGGVIVDVKSFIDSADLSKDTVYWSL
jgi:UDP-N-acetyl-D-galactosamine dehydrogenase